MRINFDELKNQARIWIYQSNRELSDEECAKIETKASQFVEEWVAHGKGLLSSSTLLYNRFLILAVDEGFNSASGCSIDASVNFIKGIQSEFGIDLLDRTNVPFLQDDKVLTIPMTSLELAFEEGTVGADTPTFNNLVPDIGTFKTSWIIPAEASWLNRYVKKPV